MCVCVRACVRACVHACVRACVRTCVRACVRACVRTRNSCVFIIFGACCEHSRVNSSFENKVGPPQNGGPTWFKGTMTVVPDRGGVSDWYLNFLLVAKGEWRERRWGRKRMGGEGEDGRSTIYRTGIDSYRRRGWTCHNVISPARHPLPLPHPHSSSPTLSPS